VKNIFKFEKSSDPNMVSGAPRLVPSNGGVSQSLSQNFLKNDSVATDASGMIDVINGFYWTSSQLSSRQDVPAIILKEKRLKQNSLIAQLAYYTVIASGKGGEAGGRLANLFSNSKSGTGAVGQLFGNTIGNAITGAGQKILGAASNFGKGLMGSGVLQAITGKSAEGIVGSLTSEFASSDVLTPYEGLYITEDTKFTYRMPYFENAANAVANAFGNDDKVLTGSMGLGSMISGAAKLAEGAAYALSTSMNIMEPGIYIEKPQFYQFGAAGDSITFSFPLINTGWSTFEDVQRNWQLIYLLIYQNRPNRKTRDLIDPPCIYEVMIPGVKYMPYAFVSGLSVNFLGSRRSYYINAPTLGGGTTKIQTIIPDAYLVNITLKGLIAESQNFLYHMLFEKQSKVNILESVGVASGITENFLDGFKRELNNQNLKTNNQKINKETQNQ
jgi:hypothetical protein